MRACGKTHWVARGEEYVYAIFYGYKSIKDKRLQEICAGKENVGRLNITNYLPIQQ